MNNIPIWVAVLGGLFALGSALLKSWLDRRSANLAIMAEISRLQDVIERHLRFWTDNVGAKPLFLFSTPVFDAQLQNIGILDTKIVTSVVKFYGYVKFVNTMQLARANFAAPGDFDKLYTEVLTNLNNDFKDAFKSAFQNYRLS